MKKEMKTGFSKRRVFVYGTIALVGLLGIYAGFLNFHTTSEGKLDNDRKEKPGFQDIASEAGITFKMTFLPGEQGENFKINLYDHGCGVAIADFDGDGFEDIYFVNQLGRNALYKNNGDGTFTDVTDKAGVGLGDRVCVGAVFADYDNDGFPDLYVTSTRGGNVLFRNMGDGTFKDVTKEAGVAWVGHSQTAVFFDFDNDGFLDLFVTNTAQWTTDQYEPKGKYFAGVSDLIGLAKSPPEYNLLFRNNGDGTFTDVTAKVGLKGPGWGGDVAVFDYDEDGYLDLLVTNMFGRSQLYHNNRGKDFEDVTRRVLGPTSFGSIGTKAFDFNNDGKLDLLIVDMHSDMWVPESRQTPELLEFVRKNEKVRYRYVTGPTKEFNPSQFERNEKNAKDYFKIQYEEVVFGNTLFKNQGNGTFQEVAQQAGLETFWPWGIAVGDFDNDGFVDVFLPSGMGHPFFYWPNRLLMNKGDETFSEQSSLYGIEPPRNGIYLSEKIGRKKAARSSRCAAVADFRKIGKLDIVTNNFNDSPYYFQNHFPKRNYIAFKLQGSKTNRKPNSSGCNRDAVGALVRIYMGKEVMVRQVPAAGGYLSQSSKQIHFGLGDRTKVDRVEIRWPGRKEPQIISNPDINRNHSITEPSSD